MTLQGSNMLKLRGSRQHLFRFLLGFFLVNILLTSLVSLNYLALIPHFQSLAQNELSGILLWIFFIISFIAQISILFAWIFLFVALINLFLPKKIIIFTLTILLSTLLAFALIGESVIFKFYHLHYLIAVVWEIFKVNAFSQVISFSISENLKLILTVVMLLFIEIGLACAIWRYMCRRFYKPLSLALSIIILFCVTTSYSVNFIVRHTHAVFKEDTRYLIVKATRFIPYYDDMYALLMPFDDHVRHVKMLANSFDLQVYENSRLLNYPQHDLSCAPTKKPLNVVIIGVDTWRYDAMNAKATPNVYQFAQHAAQFTNHWSGGNCTKSGVFTLFYGIPANYWDTMLAQQHGPELVHQLIKANYKIAVFASAQLNFPSFDQTIFREVKPLSIFTPGNTTIARDEKITNEFQQFLQTRDKHKPFFSFVFYDAVHNYCEPTVPHDHPFKPWLKTCNRFFLTKESNRQPYFNRYLNAVYFVDQQIKKVLDSLQAQHLMENTVIIITADHGEEINDNHSGYWEHASAFTPYQLRTPMIVYWPHQQPKVYTYLTTHYDVVPTLMTKVLHCNSPLSTYTIGRSLYEKGHRDVLIAGSYADYAVITPGQIARVYRGGDYSVEDIVGQPLEHYKLEIKPLKEAYTDLNAYFKPKIPNMLSAAK